MRKTFTKGGLHYFKGETRRNSENRFY